MNEALEQELHKVSFKNFYFKAIEKLKNIIQEIDDQYIKSNFTFDNFLKLKNYDDRKKFDKLIYEIEIFELDEDLSKKELSIKSDRLVLLIKEIKKYKELPEIYNNISKKIEEEDHYNNIILKEKIESYLNHIVKDLILKSLLISKDIENISNIQEIINIFNSSENIAKVLNLLIEIYLKLNNQNLLDTTIKELSLENFIKIIEKNYSKSKKNNQHQRKKIEEFLSDKINLSIKIDKVDSNIFYLYENLFQKEASREYDKIYRNYFN